MAVVAKVGEATDFKVMSLNPGTVMLPVLGKVRIPQWLSYILS